MFKSSPIHTSTPTLAEKTEQVANLIEASLPDNMKDDQEFRIKKSLEIFNDLCLARGNYSTHELAGRSLAMYHKVWDNLPQHYMQRFPGRRGEAITAMYRNAKSEFVRQLREAAEKEFRDSKI